MQFLASALVLPALLEVVTALPKQLGQFLVPKGTGVTFGASLRLVLPSQVSLAFIFVRPVPLLELLDRALDFILVPSFHRQHGLFILLVLE